MNPSTSSILLKTAITHTVTYTIVGIAAFTMLDYPRLYAETELRFIMRPTTDPLVMAGPLFQPIRGALFGLAFVMLRTAFFESAQGWWRMWGALALFGIFGTFGPSPASLEGLIYTTIPLRLQLLGMPEVLAQSGLLSFVTFHWVKHPEKRWLRWTMGVLFALALALPVLGLVTQLAR